VSVRVRSRPALGGAVADVGVKEVPQSGPVRGDEQLPAGFEGVGEQMGCCAGCLQESSSRRGHGLVAALGERRLISRSARSGGVALTRSSWSATVGVPGPVGTGVRKSGVQPTIGESASSKLDINLGQLRADRLQPRQVVAAAGAARSIPDRAEKNLPQRRYREPDSSRGRPDRIPTRDSSQLQGWQRFGCSRMSRSESEATAT